MKCPVCKHTQNWKFEGYMLGNGTVDLHPVVSCNHCQYMEYMVETTSYIDEDSLEPVTEPSV